ncbi:hypothetical protein TrLO_g12967 [Triparma laevis f. longispina]|uniref:Uncharacterized protein n=1 Tax=Triparma laevis f. longispina TaxID=1714387 RepID=A0A9W7FP05_9STRA|nr:hypothetical protein TrLO_g12967 [Triparma laevis f. longispina]
MEMLTNVSIAELRSWAASCPSFVGLFFLLVVLQMAAIYLLTEKDEEGTFIASPQHIPNINSHLHNVPGSSPSSALSPKKLPLSPAISSKSRPILQKLKNGKYRDSVTNMSESVGELLGTFKKMDGYLKKKSSTHSGWQRRFFVIDSAYIKYFTTSNHVGEVPLAAIDIRQMTNISISGDGAGHIFCFDLADGSRKYQLKAETPGVALAWVKNLQDRRRTLLEDARERGENVDDLLFNNFKGDKKRESEGYLHAMGDMKNSVHRKDSVSLTGKFPVTTKEENGIKQLKLQFPEIESAVLLRFFRASKFKLQGATDRIVDHIKWRQDVFPISFDRVKEDCARGKYIMMGRDKEGDLVIYLQAHEMGSHTYTTIEDHMNSVFFLLEIVTAEILDDPMDKFTIVYNRTRAEKKNRDLAWAENIGKTLANHYPERMKKAYVIPANVLFRTLWTIVKVFFDPDTAAKIRFLSGAKELQKYIDVDQLPVDLGGTLEYEFNVNHLFTYTIPGVTPGGGMRKGAGAQVVYELPAHFKGSGV